MDGHSGHGLMSPKVERYGWAMTSQLVSCVYRTQSCPVRHTRTCEWAMLYPSSSLVAIAPCGDISKSNLLRWICCCLPSLAATAAHRAVAAHSEGLIEAQEVRAELLRISARLNATRSPSMTATNPFATTPRDSNMFTYSPVSEMSPPDNGVASNYRIDSRIIPGLQVTPAAEVGRPHASTGQATPETSRFGDVAEFL